MPFDNMKIMIIGWAFTPHMYLNRPEDPREHEMLQSDPAYQRSYHAYGGQHKRMVELVDVLLERARAGVKVRVLVWNETNWGYMLNSHQNKHILEGLQYVLLSTLINCYSSSSLQQGSNFSFLAARTWKSLGTLL